MRSNIIGKCVEMGLGTIAITDLRSSTGELSIRLAIAVRVAKRLFVSESVCSKHALGRSGLVTNRFSLLKISRHGASASSVSLVVVVSVPFFVSVGDGASAPFFGSDVIP